MGAKFDTRENLQRILPDRALMPKDVLRECKPGSPAVLISFPSKSPNIKVQLERVLRNTDIVLERNGIMTIFASIKQKEDVETLSKKIEGVLAACRLQPLLSITYLDL